MTIRWNKPYVLKFYWRGDASKFEFTEKFYRVEDYERWRLLFGDSVIWTHESGVIEPIQKHQYCVNPHCTAGCRKQETNAR
jgi:hypothetical protein